eukprot:g5901.t1
MLQLRRRKLTKDGFPIPEVPIKSRPMFPQRVMNPNFAKAFAEAGDEGVKKLAREVNAKIEWDMACSLAPKHLPEKKSSRDVSMKNSKKQVVDAVLPKKQVTTENAVVFADAISHVVVAGETLTGISLRYGVSECSVRKLNFLNADFILHGWVGKTLMIPLKKRMMTGPPLDKPLAESVPPQRSAQIQTFLYKAKGNPTATEAELYLDEHTDVKSALQSYHSDLQWEKERKRQNSKSAAPGRNGIGTTLTKLNFEKKQDCDGQCLIS